MCALAGILACLDGFMNIALEQSEEYINGQVGAGLGGGAHLQVRTPAIAA